MGDDESKAERYELNPRGVADDQDGNGDQAKPNKEAKHRHARHEGERDASGPGK